MQLLHCIRNILCHIYFLEINCQNSSVIIMQHVRIEGVQAIFEEDIKNIMANQSNKIMETMQC